MLNYVQISFNTVRSRYWPLIKSLQTGLLLTTGVAGYMSCRCPGMSWQNLLGLMGSLFLAISGSTVLNMWYDRDIDARMQRTCWRPLPAGLVSPGGALGLGLALSVIGVTWALALDLLYGAVVFVGLFSDLVIYTIWLKRRTAWSIVWGGIAGGMPVLAGRVLGLGQVDGIGLLLSLAVLFWIPTHIMTFNLRYLADYQQAGIPTFPATYGFPATRLAMALSSLLAGLAMAAAVYWVGVRAGYLHLLALLSSGLLLLAVGSVVRPSERVNFSLFKYASLYMLSAMLLLIFQAK